MTCPQPQFAQSPVQGLPRQAQFFGYLAHVTAVFLHGLLNGSPFQVVYLERLVNWRKVGYGGTYLSICCGPAFRFTCLLGAGGYAEFVVLPGFQHEVGSGLHGANDQLYIAVGREQQHAGVRIKIEVAFESISTVATCRFSSSRAASSTSESSSTIRSFASCIR